ncbi:MAG: fimbrillin family protein [Bacteroidales bacterium]
MKSYICLFSIMLFSLFLFSCTKNINNIYILEEDCTHQKDTANTGGVNTKSALLFNAYIESINSTKSVTAMRKNEVAEIFVYKNNPQQLNDPYKVADYKTITAGVLSPIDKDTLYLGNDIYSFYSISINSEAYPPECINGMTEPLKNGVDYLWWKSENFEIQAPVVVVPVFYVHCASQVVIQVKQGNGITLDKLQSVKIYPSANGAQMSLADGIIPPANQYASDLVEMGIADFFAQYTMLPLETVKPMTAYISVLCNNELSSRTFKAEIKLPEKGLEAGKSYLFEVILNANTVQFSQVNVIDWVVVDQTGKPLYPSQI